MAPNAEADLTPRNIAAALRDFQVQASEPLAERIADYVRLLLRWNQKVSLTTVTTPREILTRHFGESLFGAQVAGIRAGHLLDVGSGAGFPALPIAMLAAEIRETLLEPNLKKAAFLAEACRQLSLVDRVTVVRARIEEFTAPKEGFDFVTSRAVRVTVEFLEKCRQMLKRGGSLVLWVGGEEIASLSKNRAWAWSEPAKIPGSERSYVLWGHPTGQ